MIPGLTAKYRVIVPDHMGFGKSETPQDKEYTLRTHVENLEYGTPHFPQNTLERASISVLFYPLKPGSFAAARFAAPKT